MVLELLASLNEGGIFSICFLLSAVVGIFIGLICGYFNLPYIYRHKVNENSRSHGGNLVAEVLHSHGVKFLFTLVGGHISPILVAAEKIGIRVVDTRHEATAVFAADAVARLTGGIGVAAVTAGPGLTNTVTAAKNAQLAESPVLLIGGAAATILKGRGALQDIDQMSLFNTICKYCGSVKTVRDIVPTLKKAIHIALSGTPGPVFVELPVDILYQYSVVKKEVLGKQNPSSLKGKVIQLYLQNYLQNIFAGAWDQQDFSPLPVSTPLPEPALVEKSAELLLRAKRPIIVVGSQVMLPPISAETLQKSLNKIGIPTYLGGMARGLLGHTNPIQIRHGRSEALKQADLIILAGAVCDFRLSYGRSLPKGAIIISVNRDVKQVYKNAGTFWKPSLAVVGDVASFVMDLAIIVSGYKCDEEWLSSLQEKDMNKYKDNYEMSEESVGEFLNPMKVLFELENQLPDNAIIVADGGDFVGTAAYILRPRGPLHWLDPGAFGTLGVGGGFALGAKLACPDAQVWIIYGDGSCGYSIAEYDTFVRHKTPVIALVGNDAGWTQIEREQKPMLGSSVGCILAHTNYHIVAQGFGAKAMVISCKASNVTNAIEAAKNLYNEGNSVLINALIGKTNFRDGSISL